MHPGTTSARERESLCVEWFKLDSNLISTRMLGLTWAYAIRYFFEKPHPHPVDIDVRRRRV